MIYQKNDILKDRNNDLRIITKVLNDEAYLISFLYVKKFDEYLQEFHYEKRELDKFCELYTSILREE